jgi:hypothetical protein
MERDIHPAEVGLFYAAALRGLRLEDTADGLYRVTRTIGSVPVVIADGVGFREVANLCGATRTVTLRQAAERDGFPWPDTPEALIAALKRL